MWRCRFQGSAFLPNIQIDTYRYTPTSESIKGTRISAISAPQRAGGVHSLYHSVYIPGISLYLPLSRANPSSVQHRSSPICNCRRSRSCSFTFKYGPVLPSAPLAFAYQSELPIPPASSLQQVTALTAPPLAVCQISPLGASWGARHGVPNS